MPQRSSAAYVTQLSAKPVRRKEIDYSEPLSLLAELALGLAGFTGVAGAFGGRERVYSEADRARLLSIFLSSGSVLAGSLGAWTLTAAGWSETTSFRWSSLAAASVLVFFFVKVLPRAYALARDPHASTSTFIALLGTLLYATAVFFHAANFILWGEAWPLLLGSSIHLGWGLFLFARILTHQN
jgi:hypothetical protein